MQGHYSTLSENADSRTLRRLSRKAVGLEQSRPVRILQFGGGNFLRGFADWIIDVMNEKAAFNSAIDIITSITPGTAEQINQQDGLYYLVQQGFLNGETVSESRLITSVNKAINPATDFDGFIQAARNPDLRFIISNTTEAGIAFDRSDVNHEMLPKSFPGKLTKLLFERFLYFNGSLTHRVFVIPLELIDKNGDTLKSIVLQYAQYWQLPEAFQSWLKTTTFCNTLVDRIVPGFPKETIEALRRSTGFEDSLTVAAEPFYFWAIQAPPDFEMEFPSAKAGLENVVFAEDLTAFRTRKIRILNGVHTALTPLAYLRGIRTVREAMEDGFTARYVKETIENEIIPTLDNEAEVRKFARAVTDRFRNPYIKHALLSISLNSVSKFKVRVLPTMLDYVARRNSLPGNLVLSLSALICFYKGEWKGEVVPLNDQPDTLLFFKTAWSEPDIRSTVRVTLANQLLWDMDLTKVHRLEDAVVKNVAQLLDN